MSNEKKVVVFHKRKSPCSNCPKFNSILPGAIHKNNAPMSPTAPTNPKLRPLRLDSALEELVAAARAEADVRETLWVALADTEAATEAARLYRDIFLDKMHTKV